jgi:hypothetical protein
MVILISFVTACLDVDPTRQSQLSTPVTGEGECLEPLFVSSFPFGESETIINQVVNQEPPNTMGWENIYSVPKFDKFELETIQRTDNGVRIWAIANDNWGKNEIWFLNTWEKKWVNVPYPSKDVQKITVMDNEEVWYLPINSERPKEIYTFMEDKLNFYPIKSLFPTSSDRYFSDFTPGKGNDIWVTEKNQDSVTSILLFNQKDNSVIVNIPVGVTQGNIISDLNGSVYFLTLESLERIRFETLEQEHVDIIDFNYQKWVEPSDFTIFVDGLNRLWINDQFWFNLDKDSFEYQIVFRSPVFVHSSSHGRTVYAWDNPKAEAFSEDGRVWFRGIRGIAWHRPETGEWCMFTTANSDIIKDDEGNLWLFYDHALYMLPVEVTKVKD